MFDFLGFNSCWSHLINWIFFEQLRPLFNLYVRGYLFFWRSISVCDLSFLIAYRILQFCSPRHPLKAVKVMHSVALRTGSRKSLSSTLPVQSVVYKVHICYRISTLYFSLIWCFGWSVGSLIPREDVGHWVKHKSIIACRLRRHISNWTNRLLTYASDFC